jgi:hypothetical protein
LGAFNVCLQSAWMSIIHPQLPLFHFLSASTSPRNTIDEDWQAYISPKKFRPFVIACFCKREKRKGQVEQLMMRLNVNTLHIIFVVSEKVNIILFKSCMER